MAQNRAPAVFDVVPAHEEQHDRRPVRGDCKPSDRHARRLRVLPASRIAGRSPLLLVYLATRMLPPIMLVVPMFLLMRNLGLIDTPVSLICAYCVFTVPFSIWLLQSYFKTMPVELEDSAIIDGCSRWQTMRYIILPLARPGLTCARCCRS